MKSFQYESTAILWLRNRAIPANTMIIDVSDVPSSPSDFASCNCPSPIARKQLTPPRSRPSHGAPCNSPSSLARKPFTQPGFSKRKFVPKKKLTWADVVAQNPPKKQAVLRSVPRPPRRMPAPLAMSGSSTDAARIKREQAAKRAQDEKLCVLRRLRVNTY